MPRMESSMEKIIGTFDSTQKDKKDPYDAIYDRKRYDRAVASYRAALKSQMSCAQRKEVLADWKRYLWAIVIFCVIVVLLLGSGGQ